MLARVLAIAMNSYREAVRARVLFGLFALALGAAGYGLVVATLSLHQEARVVADVGAASISLFAALVTIILGSTSLYRELELKTIFPILSRPLRRHEYVLGKYLGTLLTLGVFVAADTAVVLFILATQTGTPVWQVAAAALGMLALLGFFLFRARLGRVFVVIPWSLALVLVAYLFSADAGPERQLVVASAVLTMCEVAVLAAVTTLFSSFSTPILGAAFAIWVFVIGRNTDTLAHVPAKVFGEVLAGVSHAIAHVVPNLQIYVPARPLLLGQVDGHPTWPYVGAGALHAVAWAAALLAVSALIFRRRDFQ